MNKKAEIGPYLMNIFYFIMFDDHFHTHLAPGRYSNDISNIPFLSVFNNLVQFLIPVLDSSDATARFIKCLEPERTLLCQYSTKITSVPASLSLCQIGCAAQHQESFGKGDRLVGLELVERNEAHHRVMPAGRLEILADGEKIDLRRAQVVHHLEHFVSFLAEPDHDAGLGEHVRVALLDLLEQSQRSEIPRARPHCEIFRRHGL